MEVLTYIVIGVVIVSIIILALCLPEEQKEISSGELSATKEGRERLSRLIDSRYGKAPHIDFEGCPKCNGHGRVGYGVTMEKGVATFSTWGEHCPECGGTGIKGGLDYVVVDCPACEGTGVMNNVKCGFCNGTKVIKRDKGEIKENA